MLKLYQQFGSPFGLIELVVADKRLLEPVAGEQESRVTGVLGGDEIGLPQDAQGAEGNVLHIPDGGADDEEFAYS